MVWRHHLRTIINGDGFESACIFGASDSEVRILIAQYEEEVRLQKKALDPPDPAPEPPPTEPP